MIDTKVAEDEARRVAQHASVKSGIEGDVNAEIKERSRDVSSQQSGRVGQVAEEFRDRAVKETVASEHEVARSRGAARFSQYIDFAFYVIYALLATRLVLALIAANASGGFTRFINAVSWPLYMPFRGIVPSPTAEGGFRLALPVLVAIAAYLLLHAGINGALRLVAHRKTAI